MNFTILLKRLYIGGMSSFLAYLLMNFIYEIWLEQNRFNMLLPVLSTEMRISYGIQMMLMDLNVLVTVLCIILFVKSLRDLI